jgi:hypothetical protein
LRKQIIAFVNCQLREAKSYTQAGSQARGFQRLLKPAYFVEPETFMLPVMRNGDDRIVAWGFIPPRAVLLKLASFAKAREQLLFGSRSLEEQAEFWQK